MRIQKKGSTEPIDSCIRTMTYEVPDEELDAAKEILSEYEKKLKRYGFIYSLHKKAEKTTIIIVSYIFRETMRLQFATITTFLSLMAVWAIHRHRQHKLYLKREIENQEAILINQYYAEIRDNCLIRTR